MSEEIRIDIPGRPVPWARHHSTIKDGRLIKYTPDHVRAWQKNAAWLAKIAMGGRKPIEGPVSLSFVAVFRVPKSWPKSKREAALSGRLCHTSTPDLDNLTKQIDAFNGIVFLDDSQICKEDAEKRYGENPGVYVVVTPIEEVAG